MLGEGSKKGRFFLSEFSKAGQGVPHFSTFLGRLPSVACVSVAELLGMLGERLDARGSQ